MLLCCARTNLSPEIVEQIRGLLHSAMDWPYLLRMAGGHGLIPLLYFNLKNNFPDSIPAPISDQLHVQFLANAGRNLLLAEELLKILALFETNAIPAIPYKGPVLAASLYGDLTLRTFGDLDIIVRKPDIQRAKALLFPGDTGSIYPLPQNRKSLSLIRTWKAGLFVGRIRLWSKFTGGNGRIFLWLQISNRSGSDSDNILFKAGWS